MTTGDILEMLDERVVHRCATEGADEGQGLRGNLLRNHQSEACSDLGDELQQDVRRRGACAAVVCAAFRRRARCRLTDRAKLGTIHGLIDWLQLARRFSHER